MFAVWWKEIRQTWPLALLVAGVLVVLFAAWSLSEWYESSGMTLALGLPLIGGLLGSVVFAEERHAETDRFLRQLPRGG